MSFFICHLPSSIFKSGGFSLMRTAADLFQGFEDLWETLGVVLFVPPRSAKLNTICLAVRWILLDNRKIFFVRGTKKQKHVIICFQTVFSHHVTNTLSSGTIVALRGEIATPVFKKMQTILDFFGATRENVFA